MLKILRTVMYGTRCELLIFYIFYKMFRSLVSNLSYSEYFTTAEILCTSKYGQCRARCQYRFCCVFRRFRVAYSVCLLWGIPLCPQSSQANADRITLCWPRLQSSTSTAFVLLYLYYDVEEASPRSASLLRAAKGALYSRRILNPDTSVGTDEL